MRNAVHQMSDFDRGCGRKGLDESLQCVQSSLNRKNKEKGGKKIHILAFILYS